MEEHKEKIYITLTTWKKRINNVKNVIQSILNQTLKPHKIILNLCTEDFPFMNKSLPDDLLHLIDENLDIIEIYWFIENYKAWKKHLHTLEIVNDNDLIISIDDDHFYPIDFIEKMYISYYYYDCKFPITLNKIMLCHNLWTFNGPGTLYRKSDFGIDYKKYLTYDILHNCYEDIFITLLFAKNNIAIMPEIFMIEEDKLMLYNDIEVFSDPASATKNGEDKQKIYSMIDKTLNAINNSLNNFYFIDNKSVFTPSFWEIVRNLINYLKSDQNNLKFKQVNYIIDSYTNNFLQPNVYNVPFSDLDCNKLITNNDKIKLISSFKEEYELFLLKKKISDNYNIKNKLIVTISSWPNRIENVYYVINSILENTIKPDKIIINLSYDDFNINPLEKDKEIYYKVLPTDLQILIKYYSNIIEVIWYNDKELKSWKKHLYVLNKAHDEDIIVCIDDDIIYNKKFLELMLKSFFLYEQKYPITSIVENYCQGTFAFCGHSSLYKKKFFNNYEKLLNDKIIHMFPEDNHLLNILCFNGYLVMPVIGKNYLFKNIHFNETDSNFGNGIFDKIWWDNYNKIMKESDYIIENIGKDRIELQRGWKPLCYNFSQYNTEQFIKNGGFNNIKNSDLLTSILNIVEKSIKTHFYNNFGNSSSIDISYLNNILI